MTGEAIAVAAQMACVVEASAPKPGNVSRYHDFADAHLDDWLLSAAAIGPALGAAGEVGIGETVLRAVRDTRRWVGTNTNLGIVLLLAPLARAAALLPDDLPHEAPAAEPDLLSVLPPRLCAVVAESTVADAEAVYQAIRLAQPGGLGKVEQQDVGAAPTRTLLQVMELARDRDTIASEYASGFEVTFGTTLPALRAARRHGLRWSEAALEAYLSTLASVPDSLIARKRGTDQAADVSRRAARLLAMGGPRSAGRREALDRFDRSLRDAANSLNPGTTADLVAAALFVALLQETPRISTPPS